MPADEIAGDDRFAAHAMPRGIGREARQVDDRQLRRETVELLALRHEKQMPDEERMPRILAEDADADAVRFGRSREKILNKKIALRRVLQKVLVENVELRRRQRLCIVPPHCAIGFGVADDELVGGGAAGVRSRHHGKGAVAVTWPSPRRIACS